MNIIAIIPARMGSSRFPGMCKELSSTWIATCDQVVMDSGASAGLKAVMTADTHVRCTTRTAEAMLKIEEMTGQRADIVVMVQGDEPMITPDMIDAAVEPMLKDPSINVVNLMADLATEEEFEDPNEVKVVTDLNGDALTCPCTNRSASSPSAATICSNSTRWTSARWKSSNPST